MDKNISFTLKVWRQRGPKAKGAFETYQMKDIPGDTSFLEMLDILNEQLINENKEPIAFDHDCREGICGMCSLYINGHPHGPATGATTCQIYMRRFKDGDTITIEPYAIKVFKQRWYMLANNYKRPEPSIYALDRILSIQETNEPFKLPKDFDAELFFKEYYGVLCNSDKKVERIVVRAYQPLMHYLRTLPLHHSQKELQSTPEYADFEYHLRPTFDFLQELFSQINEIEVLEPASLRKEIKELTTEIMNLYDNNK